MNGRVRPAVLAIIFVAVIILTLAALWPFIAPGDEEGEAPPSYTIVDSEEIIVSEVVLDKRRSGVVLKNIGSKDVLIERVTIVNERNELEVIDRLTIGRNVSIKADGEVFIQTTLKDLLRFYSRFSNFTLYLQNGTTIYRAIYEPALIDTYIDLNIPIYIDLSSLTLEIAGRGDIGIVDKLSRIVYRESRYYDSSLDLLYLEDVVYDDVYIRATLRYRALAGLEYRVKINGYVELRAYDLNLLSPDEVKDVVGMKRQVYIEESRDFRTGLSDTTRIHITIPSAVFGEDEYQDPLETLPYPYVINLDDYFTAYQNRVNIVRLEDDKIGEIDMIDLRRVAEEILEYGVVWFSTTGECTVEDIFYLPKRQWEVSQDIRQYNLATSSGLAFKLGDCQGSIQIHTPATLSVGSYVAIPVVHGVNTDNITIVVSKGLVDEETGTENYEVVYRETFRNPRSEEAADEVNQYAPVIPLSIEEAGRYTLTIDVETRDNALVILNSINILPTRDYAGLCIYECEAPNQPTATLFSAWSQSYKKLGLAELYENNPVAVIPTYATPNKPDIRNLIVSARIDDTSPTVDANIQLTDGGVTASGNSYSYPVDVAVRGVEVSINTVLRIDRSYKPRSLNYTPYFIYIPAYDGDGMILDTSELDPYPQPYIDRILGVYSTVNIINSYPSMIAYVEGRESEIEITVSASPSGYTGRISNRHAYMIGLIAIPVQVFDEKLLGEWRTDIYTFSPVGDPILDVSVSGFLHLRYPYPDLIRNDFNSIDLLVHRYTVVAVGRLDTSSKIHIRVGGVDTYPFNTGYIVAITSIAIYPIESETNYPVRYGEPYEQGYRLEYQDAVYDIGIIPVDVEAYIRGAGDTGSITAILFDGERIVGKWVVEDLEADTRYLVALPPTGILGYRDGSPIDLEYFNADKLVIIGNKCKPKPVSPQENQ